MLAAIRSEVQTHTVGPRPDTPGAYVLNFGKFAGRPLAAAPSYYVQWLAEFHHWFEVREAARAFLDWSDDDEDDGPPPDPDSAAVKLPLIVWKWEEEMAFIHGDDPTDPAGAVVCHGRAVLRRLCAETTGRPFPEHEEVRHGA